MKRLLIALTVLGLSTSAFADSTVLVPSQKGGLKVGIDALYLRPGNSALDYATNISSPTRFSQGFEQNGVVDPTYDWGFYAQVGYLFPCTGNDLTLGYTYLNANASDVSELGRASRNLSVLPFDQLLNDEDFDTGNNIVTSNASFDLNAVDLEGGQRFTTGAFDIRMFAGVRYARIAQKLTTDIPDGLGFGDDFEATYYASQSFSSTFRGIGPRIGADGRYCLSSGFGLDAHLGASLLVGNISSNYIDQFILVSAIGKDGIPISDSAFEAKNNNTNRLVPNIDAKLGVDYTYAIPGCHKSAIVFEAGYQTTNYFNASDKSTVVDPSGTSFAYQNRTNDVSFDGIYFGVKYYA